MAVFIGKSLTKFSGINIGANSGIIRFETPAVTPATTSGHRYIYVDSSNNLIYDSGVSKTTLGAAGAVANFSLNDALIS